MKRRKRNEASLSVRDLKNCHYQKTPRELASQQWKKDAYFVDSEIKRHQEKQMGGLRKVGKM